MSNKDARCVVSDIEAHCLDNNLDRAECLRIPGNHVPAQFHTHHDLDELSHNGFPHAEINKCMRELPQTKNIAPDMLIEHAALHGHAPTT